jgi:hypothetical protein
MRWIKLDWIKLEDRLPDPREHERVLMYTGTDCLDGQRIFDVDTQSLLDHYDQPITVPVCCSFATHWMPLPLLHEKQDDDEEKVIESVTGMLEKAMREHDKYILIIDMKEPRGASVVIEGGYGDTFAVARALERLARSQRKG